MPTDPQASLFDPSRLNEDNFEDDNLEVVEIPADDPLKPFLDKYKDPAGIAKALLEKDQFINRLKAENAGMRTDLSTRVKVEEAVDRLLSTQKRTNTNNANNSAADNGADNGVDNGNSGSPNQPKALTAEDVRNLLDEERKAMTAAENVKKTKALLEQHLGADWTKKLVEKAKSIGESTEFFDALSKRNPNAVLAYFNPSSDASPSEKQPSLFATGVNTTAQTLKTTGNSGAKTYSYYEKIRKDNPAVYWSPKLQAEMHQEAIKQKEAFYS